MDYKEAAKRLNISIPAVYKALKEGRLEGTKNEDGKWDISEEAILKFQGKHEAEADLFKAEWVIKKLLSEKEATALEKINGFCTNFIKLYAEDNPNSVLWAEKISEQFDELKKIKQAQVLIGEAIMSNLTPLEEAYEKGEENE